MTVWSGLLKLRHDRRDFGKQFTGEETKRATGLGQAVAGLTVKEDTPLRGLERSLRPRASRPATMPASVSPDPDVAKPTLPSL